MIEGIKIEFRQDELRDHFVERHDHHVAKVTFYAHQVAELQKQQLPEGQTGNPIASLQTLQRKHQRQADYFLLLAGRLVIGETY